MFYYSKIFNKLLIRIYYLFINLKKYNNRPILNNELTNSIVFLTSIIAESILYNNILTLELHYFNLYYNVN